MKRIPLGVTAAVFAVAGSMAAAQTISPECVAAAANAGLSQTHSVAFDADRSVCIATPLAGVPTGFGGLTTTGGGLALGGAVVFLAVVVDSSGSTGGT